MNLTSLQLGPTPPTSSNSTSECENSSSEWAPAAETASTVRALLNAPNATAPMWLLLANANAMLLWAWDSQQKRDVPSTA